MLSINYQIILFVLCALFKFNDAISKTLQKDAMISNYGSIINILEAKQNYDEDDERNKKITCRCNICVDAYYCLTDGSCFISSKYDQHHEKIYTQGCIDKVASDESVISYFCRENASFPVGYERFCCTKNLCNGNSTIPYNFDDIYSSENLYLLTSVCAVIFLTLIAFILFFSCRLDLR